MQFAKWEIRDFGTSPISIAAVGDGPCFAKVYVTEYRKRERSPELMRAARLMVEAPAMLAMLRRVAGVMDMTDPDSENYADSGADTVQALLEDCAGLPALLARIDGDAPAPASPTGEAGASAPTDGG